MSNNKAIEIILRIRPIKTQRYQGIKSDVENGQITFVTPKDESQGYINNQKQNVRFKFDKLFEHDSQQQKIFDKVAKDVVEAAVDGYNGTIFAYGQTGSGKTFTMTGGDQQSQQGLIPRTLAHVFYLKDTKGLEIKMRLRYMQIYNAIGYDLLDSSLSSQSITNKRSLQSLPKVKPMSDGEDNLKLQNLSTHMANNLQDAMDLLFVGDTNRVVCRTEKNDQSTRSHCIFMIILETSKPGSDVKSVATINLVDLSGSQRIKETSYQQNVQRQAISINLGLHYLERLIVQLNKKMNGEKVHVPYRQSLMNLVLRDSIGGNCITRMIATMSPKPEDIMQSIATCKFAQRVALIKNNIQRNQTVDPAIIIARLKKQNAQLRAQLAILKGQDVKDELDKWQIEDCHKAAQEYLNSEDPSATLIMSDRLKVNECFYFFKNIIKKGGLGSIVANKSKIGSQNQNGSNLESAKGNSSSNVNNSAEMQRNQDQIVKLKLLLQSRENQIALLLTLLSKKRGGNALQSLPVNRIIKPEEQEMMKSIINEKPIVFQQQKEQRKIDEEEKLNYSKISSIKPKKDNWMNDNESSRADTSGMTKKIGNSTLQAKQIQSMLIKPLNLSNEDLLDQAKAFEAFRVSTRRHEAMQKNAQALKQKMSMGKQIAKTVQQSRQRVGRLKEKLEELQRKNAVNNLVNNTECQDPQEQLIKDEMAKTKQIYKESSQKLKGIKIEIQNIQLLQKRNIEQLEKDFLKYLKFKQQHRQIAIASVDSSILASNIKDGQVKKHLDSFLKAREQLRKRS